MRGILSEGGKVEKMPGSTENQDSYKSTLWDTAGQGHLVAICYLIMVSSL